MCVLGGRGRLYRVHPPGHQLRHAGLDVLDGQLVQHEQAGQDARVFIRGNRFLQLPVNVLNAAVRWRGIGKSNACNLFT